MVARIRLMDRFLGVPTHISVSVLFFGFFAIDDHDDHLGSLPVPKVSRLQNVA